MDQSTNEQKEQTQMMLIKFRPEMDTDSKLLNAMQISNLTENLHYYRNMKWILLYRLSDHGVSLNTFLKKLQMNETTLLVIEGKNGAKFGGLGVEEWVTRKDFYGNGDSFLYTFKSGDNMEIF